MRSSTYLSDSLFWQVKNGWAMWYCFTHIRPRLVCLLILCMMFYTGLSEDTGAQFVWSSWLSKRLGFARGGRENPSWLNIFFFYPCLKVLAFYRLLFWAAHTKCCFCPQAWVSICVLFCRTLPVSTFCEGRVRKERPCAIVPTITDKQIRLLIKSSNYL